MFDTIYMIDFDRPLATRLRDRKICGPYQWKPTKPGQGRGFYTSTDGLEVDKTGSTFRLRLDEAGQFVRTGKTAFWADEDGCQTMVPIIARLPHARGFLAGWTMGEGMCATLEPTIYEDEENAGWAAFSLTESDAEKEREYQAREMDRLNEEEEE